MASSDAIFLFLSQEYLYGTSQKVEVRTQFVLQKSSVRFADILRQIAEECERRRAGRKLCDVLDLDVFALPCGWRVVFDLW